MASEKFLSSIDKWDAAALTADSEGEQLLTQLHTDKTDQRVRALFRESGFKETNEWMHVPTELASNFMLFMATEISTQNRLSLITNDWGAWTGTSFFEIDGDVDELLENVGCGEDTAAESFGLFGLMVCELAPVNISDIPAEKIVEFRRKRRDEIQSFPACMDSLRTELSTLESAEIKGSTIRNKVYEYSGTEQSTYARCSVCRERKWHHKRKLRSDERRETLLAARRVVVLLRGHAWWASVIP